MACDNSQNTKTDPQDPSLLQGGVRVGLQSLKKPDLL